MTASGGLSGLLDAEAGVLDGQVPGLYLSDATEHRGIKGSADAVVLPASDRGGRGLVAWCYEHEVPIVPRGGGTGFAAAPCPGRRRRPRASSG